MYEHTLFIGLNDKDTLKQELSNDEFKSRIHAVVGDCTIQEGVTGYFTHGNGSETTEKSFKVTKFGGSKRSIINMAKQLKVDLNQESIIVDTKISTAIFI